MGGIAQGIGTGVAGGLEAGATISAANTQADAAKYAANLQSQAAQQANQLQTNEFNTQQQNLQPWLQAGTYGLGELTREIQNGQLNSWNSPSGMFNGNPNSGVNTQMATPTPFSYTPQDLQNDPGYQFQLQQGMQALQNQQSATGISGGAAAKALERYAQDYAGTSYNNAYQRALGTYQQNYQDQNQTGQENIANAESDFANNFNRGLTETQNNYAVGQQNTNTNYNRLAALAGIGQTANQQIGALGANYAASVGANTMGAAAQAGNYATQGANASAAGMVGLSNVLGNTMSSLNNQYQNASLMNMLKNYSNGGTSYYDTYGNGSNDNFY